MQSPIVIDGKKVIVRIHPSWLAKEYRFLNICLTFGGVQLIENVIPL